MKTFWGYFKQLLAISFIITFIAATMDERLVDSKAIIFLFYVNAGLAGVATLFTFAIEYEE